MRVLVTAGNTAAPIDSVRVITNVFRGRTGARIAADFAAGGHAVRLLTSFPETAGAAGVEVHPYRTFDDLHRAMAEALRPGGGFDALVHCAAVSDYLSGGIFSPAAGTGFRDGRWTGDPPALTDVSAGKVKSDEPELWLRLVRAPKLIDLVRREWAFAGTVVKFKLEVGIAPEQLAEIAERSRVHSDADLMVANTLEGTASWALLGPVPGGGYRRVERDCLGVELMRAVEEVHSRRG